MFGKLSIALFSSVLAVVAAPAAQFKKMESGLQYKDEVVGTGKPAKKDNVVNVHYSGRLADGTEFDNSRKNNRTDPFSFTLGGGEVIEGWDKGVEGMREGGKRTLIIPPELGYGINGAAGVIPPNAELTFDIELISVGD